MTEVFKDTIREINEARQKQLDEHKELVYKSDLLLKGLEDLNLKQVERVPRTLLPHLRSFFGSSMFSAMDFRRYLRTPTKVQTALDQVFSCQEVLFGRSGEENEDEDEQ